MKLMYSLLSLSIFFVACQPKVDNSAKEAFEKNSETVKANIKGFESENVDYSQYADNFVMPNTGFGGKDSLSLDEVKASDKDMWQRYDFKLLTDPLVLLPGVNVDTKEFDGSVRYYADWQVTLPATDSTEARSGVINIYEYYVFDENGKIIQSAGYGDFGGLFGYLHANDAAADAAADADDDNEEDMD